MSLDRLGTTFTIKTVDDSQRIIAGWAAYHNNVDRVADVIEPEASVKAVARLKSPADVGVFIAHDLSRLPVGVPIKIEAHPEGLYTETRVFEGPTGDDLLGAARGLKAAGAALGMSIGYRVHDARPDRFQGKAIRRLLDYTLGEYSFAAHLTVANPEAVVTGVKAGGQMYSVEEQEGRFHVMRGGKSLASFASEDEARAKADALNADGGKALVPNLLPDSAFLYIAEGGQKDDEGKTVPRALRHFRYRDHDGALDADALAAAVADLGSVKAGGLDDGERARLRARAQRLLELVRDGKTVDEEAWELKSCVALDVRGVGYDLMRLADDVASEMYAMAQLGIDTRNGARMRLPQREKIRAAIATLSEIVAQAEMTDRDDDPKAIVEWYRQWFEVAAIGAPTEFVEV